MIPKEFDIVVVGEINPDLVLHGEDVTPVFGQVEKLVEGMALTIGSSAVIFACGAARLGLKVALIGKVGKDDFGSFMRRSMLDHGIDVSGVIEDPKIQTGLTLILARGSDRAILTYPGAIPTLHFSEICLDILARARHLHLPSYFIQDALRPDVPALFDLAHRQGLTVSLDTNFDPAQKWNGGLADVLSKTDVFLPNETEACAIAGVSDLDGAIEALARKTRLIAVKCGEKGGIVRADGRQYRAQAIPVHLVDTVGAGDSFDAGFLYGYLAGWDLLRSLRLAIVCGSLSTQKPGGTQGQPDLVEALQYL